jgi:hypothetical protein
MGNFVVFIFQNPFHAVVSNLILTDWFLQNFVVLLELPSSKRRVEWRVNYECWVSKDSEGTNLSVSWWKVSSSEGGDQIRDLEHLNYSRLKKEVQQTVDYAIQWTEFKQRMLLQIILTQNYIFRKFSCSLNTTVSLRLVWTTAGELYRYRPSV